MGVEDRLPVELPTEDTSLTRVLYLCVLLATALGAAHHIDHVIRGNHVGWPLTPEVNGFTYSLASYPLIAVSLYLTLTRRVAAGYWAGVLAALAAMAAYFHIGPWAVETPQDVIGPYTNPLFGYIAYAILLALIASFLAGSVYAAVLWYRHPE